MNIEINDYIETEHYRSICDDNINISRTWEYAPNEMQHMHNTAEVLFIESGAADYLISGHRYHVSKNDILVISPRAYHIRVITSLPFGRYGVTLMPAYFKNLLSDTNLYEVYATPNEENFVKHYKNIDPVLFEKCISLLNRIYTEWSANQGAFSKQMIRSIVTELTITLFRIFEIKRTNPDLTEKNQTIIRIREFIEEHYQDDLSLGFLSSQFYLHPSTISKDFKKYCGITLNRYINSVRICEAARLLENTDYSISMISDMVGYQNINTFLRQFHAATEISPLQYRKLIMNSHDLMSRSLNRN